MTTINLEAADDTAPTVSFAVSDDVVVIADPGGPEAESISALRTHLIAKHIMEGRRGLTICACDPDDRAIWLAVNLAVSLAQANVRTLLIDCDLRAPRVHQYIVPSVEVPGLRDLLEDDTLSVGAAIQSNVLPGLAVMFSGGASSNPPELIFGNRFAQAVDLCLRDFDITIAIPPPSKSSADSRHIATLLRYALIVARRDTTLLSDVKTLMSELKLDGVRIIGSVYNAF
jgi:receptor protein-tyrosine kinase